MSDRRLPERANRGVNNRDVVNRAEEIAREQLKNRYWPVHYEDNTCDVLWSRHNSIVLDMVARTLIDLLHFRNTMLLKFDSDTRIREQIIFFGQRMSF